MLARVNSCALVGLDGVTVEVEVDISRGLPAFNIVGLPDAAVQESKERVRAAIKNAGLEFPSRRITVNLAPADVRKEGGIYDLPIAVGIMAASGQVELRDERAIFLGELSLDGGVRHANGVLPMVAVCQEAGFKVAYVPLIDAREASVVRDVTVLPVDSLQQLVAHYNGLIQIEPHAESISEIEFDGRLGDMKDIRGQEHAKRALEIAAAGGHNVLMSGPPGTGKTLLARALASILPPMTFEESLEVTKIYSVAGVLPRDLPLITERPVQAPHHTISHAGLVGGGTVPRPGAISLAHRGVLFLDEFPEFSRGSLEAMRQPLEDGYVTIARAAATATLPARFMLVAAMNPSPSGFEEGDGGGSFSSAQMARYRRRISGPILDRIDLHVDVPRIDYDKLTGVAMGEESRTIRERVAQARQVQTERFGDSAVLTNAEMGVRDVDKYCAVSADADALLRSAHDRLELSGRGLHRVLKLGRTIADLAGVPGVEAEHIAEALQYRPRTGL